jgi:hypothetical protein
MIKDLYNESYKTQMKEIKKDTNKNLLLIDLKN